MNGVPERIENCRDILIHRGMMAPDIRHRQGNVLGKGPRTVDANALHLRAEMSSACKAIAAMAANHVPLSTDNLTDKFMADHERYRNGLLRPIIPFINVEIGSANARAPHSNEHVIDADLRHFHFFKP